MAEFDWKVVNLAAAKDVLGFCRGWGGPNICEYGFHECRSAEHSNEAGFLSRFQRWRACNASGLLAYADRKHIHVA